VLFQNNIYVYIYILKNFSTLKNIQQQQELIILKQLKIISFQYIQNKNKKYKYF